MKEWALGSRISKENNYNVIRLLFSCFVLYGHMFVLIGGTSSGLLGNTIHTIGFKGLMVLSGYMVTQSLIFENKLRNYFIKRAVRLFPALCFYLLLVVIFMGLKYTTLSVKDYFFHPYTWKYFIDNLLLCPFFQLPGVFADSPYPYAINGSLWALPIEVSLYFIIFLVLEIIYNVKIKQILFTTIVFTLCVIELCHINYFPLRRFVFYGSDWWMAMSVIPYFF